MSEHRLKTWVNVYKDVESGKKPFEWRVNDRDFKVGDTLHLEEFDPVKHEYTGLSCKRLVTYILDGTRFGLDGKHVIMGLEDPRVTDLRAKLQTAEQQLARLQKQNDSFESKALGKDAKAVLDEWIQKGGLRNDPALGILQATLQAFIEQQLGQVTKEFESVRQDLYETNESYEDAAHDRDVGVKDCRRLVTELGQVRERKDGLILDCERLATDLEQACRQWKMYAEEREDEDLEKESHAEAVSYRAAVKTAKNWRDKAFTLMHPNLIPASTQPKEKSRHLVKVEVTAREDGTDTKVECGEGRTFAEVKAGLEMAKSAIDEQIKSGDRCPMSRKALSATPSDGCGKGRTDKERLDLLQAASNSETGHIVKISTFSNGTVDLLAHGKAYHSFKDLRSAIDAMREDLAASSNGKEGGR